MPWLTRKRRCAKCNGEGKITADGQEVTCPRCNGKGWVVGPSML